MTKPIIKEVNVSTGEEIEREMNDEEYAQYQADQELSVVKEAEELAKIQAKAELLARLGITAEEAQLLLA